MGLDTVSQQPPPHEGKESVTDAVVQDLQDRRDGGVKKYGMELESHNGRDALVDMYQELTDSVLYLRQYLMEVQDFRQAVARLEEARAQLFLVRNQIDTKWVFDDIVQKMDTVLAILKGEKPPEEKSGK
jgi:hypothetical protein